MRKKKFARSIGLVIVLLLVMAGHSLAEEFGWPLPGHTYITATYTYPSSGSRHSCRYSTPDGRAAGIDIGVDIGTEVYAPASGTVQKMSWQYPGFGNHFEILHDDGTITLYAHLSEYRVQNGQRVNRGDLIALTGNTGGDYGAHLHYEMKDIDGYQYYQTNGYRDPRTMSDKKSTPKYSVNPGLTGLTSSRYAKTYTLTSGHYKVYTNSDLTAEDSSHWTGYDEEDYIIGVGFNSSGEAYAQVQIPTDSGSRLTVYVSLHDVFVPGTLTESGTAVNKSGGLYKRKNDAYHSDWWIDPGDTVYLLTEDSGFCQVMYPISGYSYWRIAWLTRSDYDYVMGKGSTPSGDDTNARDKVVAYAWEIYNYTWYADKPILRYNSDATGKYVGPGWMRGIPYTLYGAGDTFEQFKSLVDNNNNGLYDTEAYTIWTGETRASVKHGMACAAFVTTCIMQGFPKSAGLSMQPAIKFHTKDGWKDYVTEGNKDYSGYAKLQKGDYLDNFSSHVILVVGNHVGSGNSDSYIEYVDQTPTYVEDNDVGTHKGTYYYSTLSSRGYKPMYVKYPGDPGSDQDPTSDEIPIDAEHFPDEAFRNCIHEAFDKNDNWKLSTSEIADAKVFQYTENKGFTSIDGIKYLTNLEWLYIPDNKIKHVDVSGLKKLGMLVLNGNELESLNASDCTSLTELWATDNKLTWLNVDNCTSLKKIYLWNNSFVELKLYGMAAPVEEIWAGGCTALKYAYVNDNPKLNTLILDNCTALERIYAKNSPSLSSININGDTSLRIFERVDSVNVPGNKPSISTTSLPDAYVGKSYSAQVKASAENTDTPIEYAISAITSEWADVFKCSSSGKITGTPSKAGSVKISIRASNYVGVGTSKSFTLNVIAKPVITTSELSSQLLYAGKTFTKTIEAVSTEAVTWSIPSGELPPGLSLNSSTGTISGTLTSLASLKNGRGEKDYSFTVRATSKAGYDEKTYKLKVREPFKIITESLKDAYKDVDYTAEIYGEGGYIFETAIDYITWATDKSSLPPGLKLTYGRSYNASDKSYVRKAVISGKPTVAGRFSVKVTALDVVGLELGSKTFSLIVKDKPTITTSAALPNVSRKQPYSVTLSASGTTPLTWEETGGNLPDGLTLTAKGKLTGTPTKAGTYSFTIKVSNAAGSDSRTFTVKVTQTAVSGTIPTTITRKASFTGTPKATGGASPYTWSISAGKLPDGLKINASTGKITGNPSKAGTFSFTVKAKDKNGAAGSKAYTVKVTQTAVKGDIPTTITRKASYTGTPKASGGAGSYTWSISSGKLPDGLKINASTGKITGTASKAGTFNFTVKAKDKNGATGSKAYTVKVTQTAVKGDIPTTITRKASYTGTPKASGGAGSYTWSISSGKLPDGLKINSKTGKISGTASKAGTFKFTVKAKDKNGAASTKAYTVKVTQTKVTGTIPGATKGSSYTATPKASDGASPYTWSISAGKLPNGLKLNSKTGKITGTATKAGTFNFTVKAKDKNGAAGTKQYTLKVTASTTTKSATPDTKPDTKNDAATSTQEHNSVSSLPFIPEPTPAPEDHTATAYTPSIRVISDDILEAHNGRDNDIFTVKAGQTLTFILDGKISGAIVYIDDEPIEGITISDEGTFTLPAEFVSGDFKVQVKSSDGKIESQEAYIISE